MTGAQKTDEYEMTGALKTREYEMTDAQKSHEYEMTDAQKTDDGCTEENLCVQADGFSQNS